MKHVQEKVLLLIMLAEIVVFLVGAGFLAGRLYAIKRTKVYYHAGIVTFELDGQEYEHIADGWVNP